MISFFKGFLLALQFLTRIPIPLALPWEKSTIRGALTSFALVGFVIGGLLISFLYFAYPLLPLWMTAFALLSLWVFLTGGLHLDGLMDVADALGSNGSLEKQRVIMKDPHVGSFSVLVVIFHLGWKTLFIYGLLTSETLEFYQLSFILLSIPASSRLLALFLLYDVPVMKREGLAFEWKKYLTVKEIIFACLPIIIILFFAPILVLLLTAYFFLFLIGRIWIKRTFHGINGDLVGASIEGGELWGLAIVWIYISFVMV
ncbi:adenosylcobinamide-GDP ribazoletransferase [Metabacillus crassostreae]|uniref:adenosylcobinamide-GDP ribazoletransferase n=1 Tax=Metabacillus crassostreae TaxID=929098 RepID=UPI00195A5E96|nr:adenosylcobinamide-GDP ribazoletransferase [Metabacillus crassostreae]